MPRKKSNDLKLTEIKREAKSLDQKETIQLDNGKDLHFYPIFKETIVQELLEEMQEKFLYINENGIELKDSTIFNFTLFYCIKYFTHLRKDIPDEFEKQIEVMTWMIDTKLFKEIIEIFDNKEINKVWDKITDFLATAQYSEKLMGDVQNKFQKLDLENRDVFEQVFKHKKAKFVDENKSDEAIQ